jgi:hypothetical protein
MLNVRRIVLFTLTFSVIANIVLGVREVRHQRKLKVARESLAHAVFVKDEVSGRREIPCRNDAKQVAVLLVVGQSNASNTLDATITPPQGVGNFNMNNGKCYGAEEPLLGTTNLGGNFATRLASRLIERGDYAAVMLAPIAVGGTYIEEWAVGGRLNGRIVLAVERMQAAGLTATHVLWHQGEGNRTDSERHYKEKFLTVLKTIRDAGVNAPIFIAQTSICRSDKGEGVRAAQRNLVDPTAKIFAGPDTDELGNEFRYDACHFNSEGGEHHAELWYKALKAPR